MSAKVAWVARRSESVGQDHLGVQVFSESLYAEMMPGLTNVTQRLRYYSFLPWLVRAFDETHGGVRTSAEFTAFVRRAECLLVCVAIRHEERLGESEARHGQALVGRDKLGAAMQSRNAQGVDLTPFASTTGLHSYVGPGNEALGGIYFGALANRLRLFDSVFAPAPRLTDDLGMPVVRAFEESFDTTRFLAALRAPQIDDAMLDSLDEFCPCSMASKDRERETLIDSLFDRRGVYVEEGMWRRRSFLLLLRYVEARGAVPFAEMRFGLREAAYAASVTAGATWTLTPGLDAARAAWATYHAGELLALVPQGLFWALLMRFERDGVVVDQVDDIMARVAPSFDADLGSLMSVPFDVHVRSVSSTLPAFEARQSADHEARIAESLMAAVRAKDEGEVVRQCVRLLVTLVARGAAPRPYSAFSMSPDRLVSQPIQLDSMARCVRDKWALMTVGEVVRYVAAQWGLTNHLRVTLRKFRAQPLDTFVVRPTEQGWRATGFIPVPQFTSPRLKSATMMLTDVGALTRDHSDKISLTARGQRLLEEFDV